MPPQLVSIISLTYLAMMPPRSTIVLAVYAASPEARANCGTPCSGVHAAPSVEYSIATSLAPKPTNASMAWLEFQTQSSWSL